MPPRSVLVDTNVWLDFYLPNRAGLGDAKHFIDSAIECDVELLYAVGSAKDVFYLAAAAGKRLARDQNGELSDASARAAGEYAWAVLDNMAELATMVGADESDRWLASKHRAIHRDFEDNLIIAAAMRAGVDYIVTCDEKLIMHAPVAAMMPGDLAALLDSD